MNSPLHSIPVRPELVNTTHKHLLPKNWVDEGIQCRSCEARFQFTAVRKRVWYEEDGKDIHLKPIRCPSCHRSVSRLRRTVHELSQIPVSRMSDGQRQQLQEALNALHAFKEEVDLTLLEQLQKHMDPSA